LKERSLFSLKVHPLKHIRCKSFLHLNQNPFTASLDEFIQHHGNVLEDKATNVKAEELCGVARG
jgi:hypothetical protein